MLKSLATALFLTERDAEGETNSPKVKGRIITTLEKAKEVRPLVERCITIARRALPHQDAADELEPNAERNSEQWRTWRSSEQWQIWCKTISPVVNARRRALRLLGNKQAVRILFDDIAPRFADRNGGYTRVMRLAKPRLGDAGTRAILELVGKNDRVRRKDAFVYALGVVLLCAERLVGMLLTRVAADTPGHLNVRDVQPVHVVSVRDEVLEHAEHAGGVAVLLRTAQDRQDLHVFSSQAVVVARAALAARDRFASLRTSNAVRYAPAPPST